MYCEHFGLEILPFKITPDPAFLYQSSQNRRALNLLRSDLILQSQIVLVTGDIGTGKTTLILDMLDQVSASNTLALLSNLPSWIDDVLPWVLNVFDIPACADGASRLQAFQNFVLSENSAGRKCVLVVDEAQNISNQALEHLHSLLGINTDDAIRFVVILVGQTALRRRLKRPDFGEILNLIEVSVVLEPMQPEETSDYIRHRLGVAGGDPDLFDEEALAAVHMYSKGCPRLVNMVCDAAMATAFRENAHRIDKQIVQMLGGRDGVLSHMPDIAKNTCAVSRPDAGFDATVPSHPAARPVRQDHADRDVFDFVQNRQQSPLTGDFDIPVPFSGEPSDFGTDEAQAKTTKLDGTPNEKSASSAPDGSGSTPTESRKVEERSKQCAPSAAQKPAGSTSLPGFVSGTIAASVMAAGALLLLPLAIDLSSGSGNVELVSMQQVSALAPVALNTVNSESAEPPAPLRDMSGQAFLDRAITTGFSDPESAALDYARAALRGEDLAAYYLGQLYETGDGVPRDLALARSWYTLVKDTVRGARRRLTDLGTPLRTGELAAPKPLLGGTLDSGGAEFVWSSGDGTDPAFFVVELSEGTMSSVRRLLPQDISAMKVDSVGKARFWRVFAAEPDTHRYSVSPWVPLGEIGTQASIEPGAAVPEALVQLPANAAPETLEDVTDILSASRIPYRVETGVAGAGDGTDLLIGYFYEADEDTARTIAGAIGAQSAVMLATTDALDRSKPFPGQIVIRATGR